MLKFRFIDMYIEIPKNYQIMRKRCQMGENVLKFLKETVAWAIGAVNSHLWCKQGPGQDPEGASWRHEGRSINGHSRRIYWGPYH